MTLPRRCSSLVLSGARSAGSPEPSPRTRLDELLDWAQRHFPVAEATHTWS